MRNESIDLLIKRAEVIQQVNPQQAIALLEDAMSISRKTNNMEGIARVHFGLGSCYAIQSSYKKSITEFNEALHLFEQLQLKQSVYNCHARLSNAYLKLGNCTSALEYWLNNLKLVSNSEQEDKKSECYTAIGKVYSCLDEHEKAIDYFRKSLKYFEELKIKEETVLLYFLIGHEYNLLNELDKAEYYLLRCLNSIDKLENVDIKSKTLGNLALIQMKKKQADKALNFFQEAISQTLLGASPAVKAQIKKDLAALYIELTQFDKAIEVLNAALKIARSSPIESELSGIYSHLSKAYEKMGDFENALRNYKLYYELDKSINSKEVNLKTAGLQISFDLEEMKKQKEIAEISDKLKEQFLANVSHEIRTPMNGVMGMAHLLEQTNPTTEQQEYIDAIKLSAQNLMVIINDILDFSKINAGKIEFAESEFNIRELIKGIFQLLQVKASEKKIKLINKTDFQTKDFLIGDPIRLNQILTNLLSNAVKFTNQGEVSLSVMPISATDSDTTIRFIVKDTGIGIPENKWHSIFEGFEQAENNKKKYEGTGLGLTIVKQLVELQNGKIAVTSKLNKGSEFTVELKFKIPRSQQPRIIQPVHQTTIDDRDYSGFKILVVEDNMVNQLLVKNMLQKFGFRNLECAENGKKAIKLTEGNQYDAILMDIQMPEMDGYEVTQTIRNDDKNQNNHTTIIALTADASEKEKTNARNAGMNDYVVKPYTPDELFATLSKHLVRNKAAVEATATLPDSSIVSHSYDLSLLEKYTGGDDDLAYELIEIFLKQVPEATENMQAAIAAGNWKLLYQVSHKIKSSISIFEFYDLKKILITIEEYARDQKMLNEIPDLFNHYRELTKPAIMQLETLRNSVQVKTHHKRIPQ